MLDVHPAHHAATTWRDFFIHIATIVLGLLIAIGLEQSVEAIHHRHQRHQLQEDLHGESVRVHTVLQENLRTFAAERIWLLAVRKDVDTMRASGGRIKLPYRPQPTSDPNDPTHPLPGLTWPPDGVWQAAKASALVYVLPQWQAEMYSRLSRQQDLFGAVTNAWIAEQTNLIAFEARFDDAGPSSTPDLSRMTPEQLDQYSTMLTRNVTLRDTIVNRSKIFDAENLAILDGATSLDGVVQRTNRQKFNLER